MNNSTRNIKCSACGKEGHRCISKKCRLYDQNKSNSAGKNKCSACGEEGHRRTSKKCQLYRQKKVTQLVIASALPAMRRDIAALAKNVDYMNIIKTTPIQPGRKTN